MIRKTCQLKSALLQIDHRIGVAEVAVGIGQEERLCFHSGRRRRQAQTVGTAAVRHVEITTDWSAALIGI